MNKINYVQEYISNSFEIENFPKYITLQVIYNKKHVFTNYVLTLVRSKIKDFLKLVLKERVITLIRSE
jgi:capsule polysaccharide export protein KpsE/RkpR